MYILGGHWTPSTELEGCFGKSCAVAPGSPGGQELQLLVPAWPNISSSRPDVSISWPPGHSCPWEHFLSAAFSWTWQEESSALITCLGEAGFGLTQAKGFVCLWKAFAGAGWAIPGFGWHPGGDAGSAG